MLAPLHLRLANVRRFLEARINPPLEWDFSNPNDYKALLAMVKKQKLPVNIRFDGHSYDLVLMERAGENIDTNGFYVLMAGIRDVVKAIATVQKLGVPNQLISFSNI